MSLLSLPAHVHYYLYAGHADMRRTFEGLCDLVRNEMQADPLDHQVYIFINRRGTQVKLLLWEGDGFSIYHKRLEAGTFERPAATGNGQQVIISRTSLQLILQGVRLQSVSYRKRYERKPSS
ncbi:transposase [Arcticibacter tournemirensis]|uniref:IS66 family insertion sequence element accessory protein TnpB n=1 Tax=Arcticibacter tournemirensis TaxID=699437 RepID=A0A5M9GHQ9_9SPHI|nr:IS66 family insertion sequence element accessory protein TnpB [Arcticibacter tournemirensis]KAA8474172.1 IS66 family insertion sequence element accessory protein TnpB [Arcticibacter tournemirensis]TQM49634.1 transposase [Arcticibacter tournemirensis]